MRSAKSFLGRVLLAGALFASLFVFDLLARHGHP
jgi:hypothetical protein